MWERQYYEQAVADATADLPPCERLERVAAGPDPAPAVSTAVRVAISHYLVRSDDDDDFLDQLRHAASQAFRALSSARMSSVCSPSFGAAERGSQGVP